MKSVKLSLLNLHFWSCFGDFGLSLLSTPYVFVPALAGYPLGILTFFGVGAAEQTYIMLTIMTIVTVSIIGLFENRFYIFMTNSQRWRHTRKLLYVVNHIAAVIVFLISYVKIPEQKMAFDFMRKFITCIPSYVDESRIFILTIHTGLILKPGAVGFAWFYSQLFLFPILTNRILSRQLTRKVSENTAKLQKSFQRALVFQVVLPVVILAFPIGYIAFSTVSWYHNQALNNASFIIISSHGFFSTISMIALHSAYREFTINLVCYRSGVQYKSNGATGQEMRQSVIT